MTRRATTPFASALRSRGASVCAQRKGARVLCNHGAASRHCAPAQPFRAFTRLKSNRGASIIIALAFFLICAGVGSAVVTAASVQAKQVQTHRELQQAEFTMSSAAQTVARELETASLTVSGTGDAATLSPDNIPGKFGNAFWGTYGADVLKARANQQTFAPTDQLSVACAGTTVYGSLKVDADLNITVNLSLSGAAPDEAAYQDSPYNMTVRVQCVPTYNEKGELTAFSYRRAVISKTNQVQAPARGQAAIKAQMQSAGEAGEGTAGEGTAGEAAAAAAGAAESESKAQPAAQAQGEGGAQW